MMMMMMIIIMWWSCLWFIIMIFRIIMIPDAPFANSATAHLAQFCTTNTYSQYSLYCSNCTSTYTNLTSMLVTSWSSWLFCLCGSNCAADHKSSWHSHGTLDACGIKLSEWEFRRHVEWWLLQVDSQLCGFTVNLCQYVQEELSICLFGVFSILFWPPHQTCVQRAADLCSQEGHVLWWEESDVVGCNAGGGLLQNSSIKLRNIASKNCCLRSNRTIFNTTTFATTSFPRICHPSRHLSSLWKSWKPWESQRESSHRRNKHRNDVPLQDRPRSHASLSGAV